MEYVGFPGDATPEIAEVADHVCGFTPELAALLEDFIVTFTSILFAGIFVLVGIALYKFLRIFF